MARITTSLVIAEIEATKIASVELKAPIGVDVDLKTGELTEMVRVELAGDPVLIPTIIPGKLINVGFLKATLIAEPDNLETQMYLPIYSVTKVDGIKPGDRVIETSELEHISVSGLPDIVPAGHSGYKVKIFVRALLKVMITVTREEIISLPEDKDSLPPRSSSDRVGRPKETVFTKKRSTSRLGKAWNMYWGYMQR